MSYIRNFLSIDKNIQVKKLIDRLENSKKNTNQSIAIKFKKKSKKVDGVISLGDLRRLIFTNKHEDLIYKYLNRNPYYLPKIKKKENIEIFEKKLKRFIEKDYDDIFIYDDEKNLIDIKSNSDLDYDYNFNSICIIGLGHIGLPLLTHMLKKTNFITGYDNNSSSIKKIKKQNLNFFEKGLDSLLKYNLNKNKIRLTDKFNKINANVYIVCLGSDIKSKKVNNSNLISSLKIIGKKIYKNNLILIRGTVQVGFTNIIAKKILEKTSGLKCGKDFFLGYMPERIVEGNAINELENLPQLISGVTKGCLNRSINFCNNFFSKVIETSSTEEAEIIKLSSNSFRDLNFAFANEIARIANLYNLSGHELIRKANLGYQRNSISKPSMGVGGFCLPKDIYLFNKMVDKKLEGYKLFISREINEKSLNRISKKIINLHKKNFSKKNKVLILGATFKGLPETIDIRNSPAISLSGQLTKNKIKNYIYDLKAKEIVKNNNSIKNFIFNSNLIKNFDIIILTNNNTKYSDLIIEEISKTKNNKKRIIFDCWNLLDREVCKSSGFNYYTI
ncbi:nucleotide sugar dehydrogenase [Candidatus Pelagibacter sp.]|nr:nucleotide sugar dehydrogenase [Candidatus Pelagibacter sp.]